MTADEIRADSDRSQQFWLREIAAQLAEHNERENRQSKETIEQICQTLWDSGWRPKP